MTKLDLFLKIFANFSGKTEEDMTQWANDNMTEPVRNKLSEPIPDEEADALFNEYKENPLAVMRSLAEFFPIKGKTH